MAATAVDKETWGGSVSGCRRKSAAAAARPSVLRPWALERVVIIYAAIDCN